jgi:hypothetical protein
MRALFAPLQCAAKEDVVPVDERSRHELHLTAEQQIGADEPREPHCLVAALATMTTLNLTAVALLR